MKIIVDNKIPFIREAMANIDVQTVYVSGMSISKEDLKDADAMIIRTRTHCDAELLEGSNVKFIATATIGHDHIDKNYLEKQGIAWTNCPGCNASSVGQYIHSVMLVMEEEKGLNLKDMTFGIVGVGNVGKEVEKAISTFGCKILLNDPPREDSGEKGFVSLEQMAEECDVISFHTPLTFEGLHPTYHLASNNFFSSLTKRPLIINSGRGEVVDNRALLYAMEKHLVSEAAIDTWENEPQIAIPLLEKVFLGTPHIAGYSADGKANATRMSLEALCRFFSIDAKFSITPPALPADFSPSDNPTTLALQLYDPRRDSNALKAAPEKFEFLRSNYPLRREYV